MRSFRTAACTAFRHFGLTVFLAVSIPLLLPDLSQAQESTLPKGPAQAIDLPNSITEGLRNDVQFLASEDLRGRSVTDDSIKVAADYLAERMRGIGLKLNRVEEGPFQEVEIEVGSEVGSLEKNHCTFLQPDGKQLKTSIGSGFGPLTIGVDDGFAKGPLVFAGYGITSKVHAYDDYERIDANGAVVMILRKEPLASDPESPFDGVKNTRHAYFATKVANAIEHGAVGILFINDPASARDAAQLEQNRIDQEQRRRKELASLLGRLPSDATKNRSQTQRRIAAIDQMMDSMETDLKTAQRGVLGIGEAGNKAKGSKPLPIASIGRDIAGQLLLAHCGQGLEELETKIDQTIQPASQAIPSVIADLSVNLKPAVALSDNVIGLLPGRGALSQESLVIGAHYDHVGMGGFASLAPGTIAIHNGADDNASGTAAMLACAQQLKERLSSFTSHRNVIFIGFTGEERGLVGSQYYVDHPVEPLERTAAMINLDMVGRLRDNELTVYGTGSADQMDSLVEKSNRRFGFNLFKVASGFGPSDHQSFYRKGVPVLFFFTGLHNDYHRPSDDFDKIDFGDLTRVTDMVSDVAFQLAVLPERPRYAETDKRVQIRRQMTAYLGVRVSSRQGAVRITEVTEGGPASKSGLKTGDEIQRIGNKQIHTTNDVLSWVRGRSPSDPFEIHVRRNAVLMTLSGKLEKRPGG